MPAKRTLLLSLLTATIGTLAHSVNADGLSVSAGIEYWQADLTGEAQDLKSKAKNPNTKPVNFDEWRMYGQTYKSLWLNFEHPVPLVPELRMSYTNLENYKVRNRKVVNGNFTIYYTETASLIFDNIDATLYYHVLDDWLHLNIDAGLTARTLNGEFDSVQSITHDTLTVPSQSYTKLNQVVPMLYLNGRFNIPYVNGLYIQSVFNGISAQGSTLYDADARIGYDLDLHALKIGLYSGYRRMVLKTSNLSNLYADASMDGWMTGLETRF